jgi:hypothetical protein
VRSIRSARASSSSFTSRPLVGAVAGETQWHVVLGEQAVAQRPVDAAAGVGVVVVVVPDAGLVVVVVVPVLARACGEVVQDLDQFVVGVAIPGDLDRALVGEGPDAGPVQTLLEDRREGQRGLVVVLLVAGAVPEGVAAEVAVPFQLVG